jgi:hypothetical protein
VSQSPHPGTGHVDVLRHVGVARDDADCCRGATGQLGGRHLARVQRVDAEAEPDSEGRCGVGRDLRGLVGEVAVHALDREVPEVGHECCRLLGRVTLGQHPQEREQLVDSGLRSGAVAGLGGVETRKHARPRHGHQLTDGERLRRAGEPAHDDRQAGHADSSRSRSRERTQASSAANPSLRDNGR